MKALVAVLVCLVLCLGAAGGLFYKTATEKEANLTAQLSDAKHRSDGLAADLAAAEKKSQTLTTELAESTKKADGLAQSLSELRESLASTQTKLAQATAAGEKASHESDALAGLLSRKIALEKLVNDDLQKALDQVRGAEQTMRMKPSKVQFSALKNGYVAVAASLDKAGPMLTELGSYMKQNEKELSGSTDVIDTLNRKIGQVSSVVPTLRTRVTECQAAATEGSLGVYANQSWQTSDVSVATGTIVCVDGIGEWVFAPLSHGKSGPEGIAWNDEYRVLKSAPNGALLARIHGSEQEFVALPYFKADTTGKVELRINDTMVNDNTGTVQATFWTFRTID